MADASGRGRPPSSQQGKAKRSRVTPYELARKPPDSGSKGSPVDLRANYFPITGLPTGSARLYEVDITPAKLVRNEKKEIEKDIDGNEIWTRVENLVVPLSRPTNRRVIACLVELYKDSDFGGTLPGYDGDRLLYAREVTRFDKDGNTSEEFLVDFPEEASDGGVGPEKRFYVTLSRPAYNEIHYAVLHLALAGKLPTVPQDAISALETVFKGRLSTTFKVVGQSFFDPARPPVDLGGGIECWTGFHQSLKAIQGAEEGMLALNLDTAVTAFVKPQPVIDFVAATLNLSVERLRTRPPLTPSELQRVEKALHGLTLEVIHLGAKKKKIRAHKISTIPVGDIRFEWRGRGDQANALPEARECSVPEYFMEQYGRDLRFAHLPAFLTGANNQVATPFEVCVIAKGNRVKKLNEIQRRGMIKEAAQKPATRRALTKQVVQVNDYNGDPLIRDWGLEVAPEMMLVPARVLFPPQLEYRFQQRINRAGNWNLMRPMKQLYRSVPIDKWALLNFASRAHTAVSVGRAWRIAQELVGHSNTFGLPMRALAWDGMVTEEPPNFKRCIGWLATRLQPTFVLVILPRGKIPLYADVKRECEVLQHGGLVTQCCSADKILNADQQYYANLIQKINTKTGGQNVTISDGLLKHPKLENTLFMGADVSRAAGHRADVPSVAAVVGSLNTPVPTRYQAEVSVQKPRQEVIENLYTDEWKRDPEKEGAIRVLLKAFRFSNGGRLPSRIIFYRDGVSDGQFRTVLHEEVAAIKEACNSIDSSHDFPLTFIIVQKRHHTRFYPQTTRDGDNEGNIKPGTVVDSVVSHPSLFDFFLTSHEGIQGTSRPIHYYVVYDENNFSPDEIQGLTNDLCYTYAACTRSISVAPPAYYADLAATRARLYMQDSWDQDTASVSSGEAGAEDQWRKYELPRVQENLKKRMVFF